MAENPYLADKHLAFCWEAGYSGGKLPIGASPKSLNAWEQGKANRLAETPVIAQDETRALAVCAQYVGAREHEGHYYLDDKPWNALLDDGDAWRLAQKARWAVVPDKSDIVNPIWIAGPIDGYGKTIECGRDRCARKALVVGLANTIGANARVVAARLKELARRK